MKATNEALDKNMRLPPSILEPETEATRDQETVTWREFPPGTHFFARVVLGHREGSNIPVYVPSLPGVVSQGRNEKEALKNILEALQGVIEDYQASGDPIPWQEEPHLDEEITRWISVDVE